MFSALSAMRRVSMCVTSAAASRGVERTMDTSAGKGVRMTEALPSPRLWASRGSEQMSCVGLSMPRDQVLPCSSTSVKLLLP
jgi:hypothetical protein